ncbi:MAG: hypothetical protein AB7V43_20805 [Acidimicrobiia bacterium]
MTTSPPPNRRVKTALLAAVLLAGGGALAACSSGSSSSTTPNAATPTPLAATDNTSSNASPSTVGNPTATPQPAASNNPQVVLPVKTNPISNASTAKTLTIDSVLVENNVGASGKVTDDHLEIAMTNTGKVDLTNVEIYYTFTDPATKATESYYTKLPASFTIAAGKQRVAHFDDTGATDHFPVSKFSLYYTDTNALDVTVTVSASGAAVQTASVKKDAGGPETAD